MDGWTDGRTDGLCTLKRRGMKDVFYKLDRGLLVVHLLLLHLLLFQSSSFTDAVDLAEVVALAASHDSVRPNGPSEVVDYVDTCNTFKS